MPRGWAWDALNIPGTFMRGRNVAVAEMLYLLHRWSCELLPEFHCFSQAKTTDSWNADYGLPDDCGLNDLCAKVIAIGGQNCVSFVEMGAMLGFDLCCQDVPAEIQTGCWRLGVEPLGPEPDFRYGGCELGYIGLPCPEVVQGSGLGYDDLGPDDCNVAGYYEIEGAEIEPDTEQCRMSGCENYDGGYPSGLLPGCYRPYSIEHYTGNAHHWIVGLTTDNQVLGTLGYCEPAPPIDEFQLGETPLGTAVPGRSVPESYAIGGCWDLGVSELCQPPIEPVMCFVMRYKPAHSIAVRRYCDEGAILQ